MCPALPISDGEGDGIATVGGKVSNRITMPKFSKVVVGHPQRTAPLAYPDQDREAHCREVHAANANKYERLGSWVERIGWETFFKPFTGLEVHPPPLTTSVTLPYYTWRQSTQFKF